MSVVTILEWKAGQCIDLSRALEVVKFEGYWDALQSLAIPIVAPADEIPDASPCVFAIVVLLVSDVALTFLDNEYLWFVHKDCGVDELARGEECPQVFKLNCSAGFGGFEPGKVGADLLSLSNMLNKDRQVLFGFP